MTLPREERLPPRWLPLLYFGFAHLCLVAAVALDPRGVAGFYYHPRMVAVVHLVTLGWITASILGAVYMIGPMALREVRWMARNPRPAPKDLRRPDLGVLHVAQALGYLLLSAAWVWRWPSPLPARGRCPPPSSTASSAWWASWRRW